MIEFFYCNKRFEKFDGFYFDENIFNKIQIVEKYGVFNECESISQNILDIITNNNHNKTEHIVN